MKKVISALIMIIMLFTLTSCGSEDRTGLAKTPDKSSELKGKDYQEVVKEFQDRGFINVKAEKIEDLIVGWLTSDGEVEEVLIGGNKEYESGKWLGNDVEVIIRYHTFPAKEEKPEEDQKPEEPKDTDKTEDNKVEEPKEPDVFTIENCEDFAFILTKEGQDYENVAAFAKKYKGKTIEFDGSVDDVANYKDYKTRYNVLFSAYDYSKVTQTGPTFKMVNLGPGNLKINLVRGSNVRIVAKVESFDSNTGIFFLAPVSFEER